MNYSDMTDEQINQCQGCQAGWPIEKHAPWPKGSKSMNFHSVVGGYDGEKLFCTKHRYSSEAKG